MKTVSKVRKAFIAKVFENVKSTSSYHYDDMTGSQRGAPDAKWIQKELWEYSFTKLYYMGADKDGNAKYWVRVHSNCNYDFVSTVHPEVK